MRRGSSMSKKKFGGKIRPTSKSNFSLIISSITLSSTINFLGVSVRVKAQLYRLMILETTRNGELGKLTENLAHVRAMDAVGLGFPEGMQMPDSTQMELISKQLRKMQVGFCTELGVVYSLTTSIFNTR